MRSRKFHDSGHLIFYILYFIFALFGFTSCDLLDFDVDSDLSKVAAAMALNYDTIYVTPGTFIALKPTFDPDTLNTKDYLVWSSDTDVVSVNRLTGRIKAEAPGWARLYVETVSSQLKDSCTVNVIPDWRTATKVYPYETVFYADVTFRGNPLNENMIVAAFVGEEIRGIGEVLTFNNSSFIQLRVGGDDMYGNSLMTTPGEEEEEEEVYDNEDEDEDDNEDDNEDANKPQPIVFRCYDPILLRLYECPDTAYFNGATLGKPSEGLYKIEFK